MKTFVLSIVLIMTIIFTGCVTIREIPAADQEKIFEHKVDITKPEIKAKVLSLISEVFSSGKAVIQVNDEDIISGNYYEYLGSYGPGIGVYGMYTFIVKFSDNSVKAKIIIKDMETRTSNGISPFDKSYWATFENEVRQNMKKFDDQLIKYITNKNDF